MKPSQINALLITITFCLAFLGWGTIVVFRTVLDKNYRAPTTQEMKTKAFEQCSNASYGNANTQCAAITK